MTEREEFFGFGPHSLAEIAMEIRVQEGRIALAVRGRLNGLHTAEEAEMLVRNAKRLIKHARILRRQEMRRMRRKVLGD